MRARRAAPPTEPEKAWAWQLMLSQSPAGKQLATFWGEMLTKDIKAFQPVVPRVSRGPQARELADRIYGRQGRQRSNGKRARGEEEADMET
eukprot:218259-Amphidinium_carterae.1